MLFNKPVYYCPRCLTQNSDTSVFCGNCGANLPTSQQEYIYSIVQSARNLIHDKYVIENGVNKLKHESQLIKHEIDRLLNEKNNLKSSIAEEKHKAEEEFKTLQAAFEDELNRFDKLQAETTVYDLAYYAPRYNFESSEVFRLKLENVRNAQKDLIRAKEAAKCLATWTVNGSAAKGRKQVNDTLKLMLFAFNGEADVHIAKVKYNNIFESEKRIQKSFELINKLGESQQCYITTQFFNLKLEELYLAHEYQEKVYEEKEEQRRIREQIREEEIARREIEKALQEAEREENRYEEALRKAREEVEKATGEKQAKYLLQIDLLQRKLEEALANKERAISRAQMTRSGHVYVISNVGSFGEDIYKIGMTRRLDPMDRVRELGDASVPFPFDVHAIIYCEDAPTLENKLHKLFHHRRVNAINERKEFFRVSLDEIAAAVRQNHGEIEFTKLAEAAEFRKTAAFVKQNQMPVAAPEEYTNI